MGEGFGVLGRMRKRGDFRCQVETEKGRESESERERELLGTVWFAFFYFCLFQSMSNIYLSSTIYLT